MKSAVREKPGEYWLAEHCCDMTHGPSYCEAALPAGEAVAIFAALASFAALADAASWSAFACIAAMSDCAFAFTAAASVSDFDFSAAASASAFDFSAAASISARARIASASDAFDRVASWALVLEARGDQDADRARERHEEKCDLAPQRVHRCCSCGGVQRATAGMTFGMQNSEPIKVRAKK
jgi:hypothetical protein